MEALHLLSATKFTEKFIGYKSSRSLVVVQEEEKNKNDDENAIIDVVENR